MAQRNPNGPPGYDAVPWRGMNPNEAARRDPSPASSTASQQRIRVGSASSQLSKELGKGKGKDRDKGRGRSQSPEPSVTSEDFSTYSKGSRKGKGKDFSAFGKGKGKDTQSPRTSITSDGSRKGKGKDISMFGKGRGKDISPAPSITSEDYRKGKGKELSMRSEKGKGRDRPPSISPAPSITSEDYGKGKGKELSMRSEKGKGRDRPPSPAHSTTSQGSRKGKGKGKDNRMPSPANSTTSSEYRKGKGKDLSMRSNKGKGKDRTPSPANSTTSSEHRRGKGQSKGKEFAKGNVSHQATDQATNRVPSPRNDPNWRPFANQNMVPDGSANSRSEPYRNNRQPDMLRDGSQSRRRAAPPDSARDQMRFRDGIRADPFASKNEVIIMVGLSYEVVAEIKGANSWTGQAEMGNSTIYKGLVGRLVSIDEESGDAEMDFGEPVGKKRVLQQHFSKLKQAQVPVTHAVDADELLFNKNSIPGKDDVCSVCVATAVPIGSRPKTGVYQKLMADDSWTRPGDLSVALHARMRDFFKQCRDWGAEAFSD